MENKLIAAKVARNMCGGVSDMTFWRWLNNPAMAFPKPVYIGNRRYFRESDISDWIESQSQDQRGAA